MMEGITVWEYVILFLATLGGAFLLLFLYGLLDDMDWGKLFERKKRIKVVYNSKSGNLILIANWPLLPSDKEEIENAFYLFFGS